MVEIVVVMIIFLAAGMLIFQVARSLSVSYRTGETKIQVEENLRAAMASVMLELRQAQRDTLAVTQGGAPAFPSGDAITFRVPEDLDGNGNVLDDVTGLVEFSVPITFRRASDGRLFREQDFNSSATLGDTPGEIQIVAHHLSSAEFYLTEVPGAPAEPDIRVTLTVERGMDQDAISHTLQEMVIPRN